MRTAAASSLFFSSGRARRLARKKKDAPVLLKNCRARRFRHRRVTRWGRADRVAASHHLALMPSFLDLLDDLRDECIEVARIARGDHAVVGYDLCERRPERRRPRIWDLRRGR
jgi:hypothetical protein